MDIPFAAVVLGLLEVAEDGLVSPARVAHGLPVVEVPPVASHVHHPVEHRGAAQASAARERTHLQGRRG